MEKKGLLKVKKESWNLSNVVLQNNTELKMRINKVLDNTGQGKVGKGEMLRHFDACASAKIHGDGQPHFSTSSALTQFIFR